MKNFLSGIIATITILIVAENSKAEASILKGVEKSTVDGPIIIDQSCVHYKAK